MLTTLEEEVMWVIAKSLEFHIFLLFHMFIEQLFISSLLKSISVYEAFFVPWLCSRSHRKENEKGSEVRHSAIAGVP